MCTSMTIGQAYQCFINQADSHLSDGAKEQNREFLSQFTQFFQSTVHNDYLCELKSDWETDEPACSACHSERAVVRGKNAWEISMISQSATFRFETCNNSRCIKKVDAYISTLKQNFGQFSSAELQKSKVSIGYFGEEFTDYDVLKTLEDDGGWRLRDIYILSDRDGTGIFVYADLGKYNRGCGGYKTVKFDELMQANPDRDFSAVANEMPATIGGRFIRQYIRKLLPGEQVPRPLGINVGVGRTSIEATGQVFEGDVTFIAVNGPSPYTSITTNSTARTHIVGTIILCRQCMTFSANFNVPCSSKTSREGISFEGPNNQGRVKEDGVYNIIDQGSQGWQPVRLGSHKH